ALFVAGMSMARVGMAGMALAETIRVCVRPVLGMVLEVHASSTKALAVATAYRLARRRRRARRRPFAPVPKLPAVGQHGQEACTNGGTEADARRICAPGRDH